MDDLLIFPDEFVPNIQSGEYHKKWVRANPGENARWVAFRDAVIAGQQIAPPVMSTYYGRALVAAGKEHMSLLMAIRKSFVQPGIAVEAPRPPASYSLPGGYTYCDTSAELVSALESGTQSDIVVANGVYTHTNEVGAGAAHRVYAENLLGATIEFGIGIGNGTSGGVFQGLKFHVTDPLKTWNDSGAAIYTWGTAAPNLAVRDCRFNGDTDGGYGVYALNPTGLTVERCAFYDLTEGAVRATDNTQVVYPTANPHITRLWDLDINGVSRDTPGESNGTAEAGMFIGHQVDDGIKRIRCRRVGWAGIIVINNFWDTTCSHLDFDMESPNESAAVGFYGEHDSVNLVVEYFSFVGCKTGVVFEWNQGTPGNLSSYNPTVRYGTMVVDNISAPYNGHRAGIYADLDGTDALNVHHVTINGVNWACIGYTTTPAHTFSDIDFSGRLPGCVRGTTDHISTDSPTETL
jgi:hypothetical protein